MSADEINYFNQRMMELLEFRADHGHLRVPKNGGDLGKFVKSLRVQYKKKQLPEKRIKILRSIGFEWDSREYERSGDSDARWNERFNELVEYKRTHGTTMVPQLSGELGRWVKMQREQKKEADKRISGSDQEPWKRQRPCMPPERIQKLESIGFSWESTARQGWDTRFQELLEYRQQHGDCNVPQHYSENRSLGRWVMKQRCMYTLKKQGKKSPLTDEKETRLKAIGFAWVAPGFNPDRKKRKLSTGEEELKEEIPLLPPEEDEGLGTQAEEGLDDNEEEEEEEEDQQAQDQALVDHFPQGPHYAPEYFGTGTSQPQRHWFV